MTAEATTLPVDVAQPDDAQFTITDLAPAARAVVALKSTQTEQDLLAMAVKHTSLVEIKDKAGREQVHGAAMELMRARTSVKARGDEVREDAKQFNQAVLDEQARLIKLVEPEEKRLKALRDAWDVEQERIKREAEEKERARVLALGARIQEIRGFARLAQDCRSSDAVRRLVERLGSIDMTGFAEFEAEAINVLTETRQQVEQVLNARMATEAEAARLKAEREELERNKAEAQRLLAEIEAKQKAEADRMEAERAEFARQQQEAADKLAEQQAEVARMRAELEAAKAPLVNPMFTEMSIAEIDKIVTQPAVFGVDMASKPDVHVEMKFTTGEPSQHAAQIAGYEFVTGLSVSTIPDADLVDTASPIVIGIDMGTDAPPAASLIKCIAFEYGVDQETACRWLYARAADFEAWVPAVADIA